MKMKQKTKTIVVISIIVLVAIVGGIVTYLTLSTPSADDILKEITSKDNDAVVSVGIWENGKEESFIYTVNGKEEYSPYTYQIGSITKTFTAAMISYEENKGNLSLEDGNPPYSLLVTHKSGLKDQWEQELKNHPSATFTREKLESLTKCSYAKERDFEYSNFGSALAGIRAAEVYEKDKKLVSDSYQEAMDCFIKNELGLENTKVGGKGDFQNNWDWKEHDEMMASGAITSNVSDLLQYGSMYLEDSKKYSYLKNAIAARSNIDDSYDIGMFWIIDKKNGIIWHNGELAMDDSNGNEVGYQSFIGLSPEKNKVVVILSNSICNDEDDTAYTDLLGYLLMD